MHDPMVVAHTIPSPIPRRKRWAEKHHDGRRWGFTRRRRTNAENLGEPVYAWWRPAGWTFALGGRVYGLGTLATIWHVEPGGRDAFTVCKRRWKDGRPSTRWKWHVHHWHVQIPALQGTRARLFDRCALCGRRGRPNISYQWDSKPLGWRKWRSGEGLYHRECSELHDLRRIREEQTAMIRSLVAAVRMEWDVDEEETVNRLGDAWQGSHGFTEGFRMTSRLAHLHGMRMRHRDARWVKPEGQTEELI